AAENALKRPLDGPARSDQSVQKLTLRVNGVDQPGASLGADDGVDKCQRLIGAISEQRADVSRVASIADEGYCLGIGYDAGVRPRGELREQGTAVESHSPAVANGQCVEIACR